MNKIQLIQVLLLVAGKECQEFYQKILENYLSVTATSADLYENITESPNEEREEVINMHRLLDAYNSILYRYNQDPIQGRKIIQGSYNFQSKSGRPDRHRDKYTPDEAMNQLHNIDQIFPYYQMYYNVSNATDVEEILTGRINNVAKVLEKLGEQSNGLKMDMSVLMIILMTLNFMLGVLN